MSTEIESSSPQPEGLQFERAEFDAPTAPMTCPACQRTIEGEYFAINGAPCCEQCRDGIVAQLRGGSGIARILRAMVLGAGAALISAVGYFSFIHFLHLDWSLISVLVGFFIGKSVRKGSGNRGGVVYQILAVVLTYFAVAVTYTAVAVAQMQMQGQAQEAPADPAEPIVAIDLEALKDAPAEAKAEPIVAPVPDAPKDAPAEAKAEPDAAIDPEAPKDAPAPAAPKAEAPGPVPVADAPEDARPRFDAVQLGIFLVFLIGLLVQIPVLVMRENPMTMLIVGFALWEAWKLNKRLKLEISGPYRIRGPEGGPAGDLAHA